MNIVFHILIIMMILLFTLGSNSDTNTQEAQNRVKQSSISMVRYENIKHAHLNGVRVQSPPL